MNKSLVVLAMLAAAGVANAQETGRVISSTPVMQQVAVPRQVCSEQQVVTPGAKSGAGAAIGAIAGGAMGNAVGHGGGRAAATMIGILGGAVVGDRIEGSSPAQVSNVQQCTTQTFYESRAVSYNVVYEFNGKQYSVNMPRDPGPFIRLQITPISANPSLAAPIAVAPAPEPTVYAQASYVQAPVVTYPVYYARPAYYAPLPIGVSLHLGYSNWHGHHWH